MSTGNRNKDSDVILAFWPNLVMYLQNKKFLKQKFRYILIINYILINNLSCTLFLLL